MTESPAPQAALDAFQGYARVTNGAYRNPVLNGLRKDLEKYATKKVVSEFLATVSTLVRAQVHQEGDVVYDNLTLKVLDTERISMTVCVDTSKRQVLFKSGNPAFDEPESKRTLGFVTFEKDSDRGWLVAELEDAASGETC